MKVVSQNCFHIDVDEYEISTLICALSSFKKEVCSPHCTQIQCMIEVLECALNE